MVTCHRQVPFGSSRYWGKIQWPTTIGLSIIFLLIIMVKNNQRFAIKKDKCHSNRGSLYFFICRENRNPTIRNPTIREYNIKYKINYIISSHLNTDFLTYTKLGKLSPVYFCKGTMVVFYLLPKFVTKVEKMRRDYFL